MRAIEPFRPLTPNETAAVAAFAAYHGRNWKKILSETYWYNARLWPGTKLGMGSLLHDLRNSHGHVWLAAYKIPRSER